MRFFTKIAISNRIWTGGGWPIPFEDFGDGNGGIATNDSYIIAELGKCITEERGGVEEVTEAEFEAFKKKEKSRPLRIWREVLDVRKLGVRLAKFHDAAVAAGKRLPDAVNNFNPRKVLAKPSGISDFRPKAVAR